jgi:hypothetical protein
MPLRMLAVNVLVDAATSRLMASREISPTGNEEGHCRRPRHQLRAWPERDGQSAKTDPDSEELRLPGVKVGRRTDPGLLVASSKNARLQRERQQHPNSIINGELG